jgi:deoxyribodipyrimidine photo-lyase
MSYKDTSDKNSLVIFRRDLRFVDNTALISAIESSKQVIPIFIYDRFLLNNPNHSNNAIQFMQESILDLQIQLEEVGGKLYLFEGKPWLIVRKLLNDHELDITSIFINRDYTPYSQKRDNLISKAAKDRNVKFRVFSDLLLNEPESVVKKDGQPYTIFTPFYRKAREYLITAPKETKINNFFTDPLEIELKHKKKDSLTNPHIFIMGGRKNGLNILSEIDKFQNYETERDFPAIHGTTLLSAHLRFGTISIREAYHRIYNQDIMPLVRQLYWRDFYHYIGFYFPHVFNRPFRKKYQSVKWSDNREMFNLWSEGKTGFPIIDAGMRQLNKTGFMNNRRRMIVASFLIKDLQINWQWGEKYFAQKLIDYDVSVNNGNWQWSSSTGCDPVPYFRVFNPWTQQRKFDPKCEYIKKYIPELRNLKPKEIHKLEKLRPTGLNYPKPIVNHSVARKQTILMFKNIQEI